MLLDDCIARISAGPSELGQFVGGTGKQVARTLFLNSDDQQHAAQQTYRLRYNQASHCHKQDTVAYYKS